MSESYQSNLYPANMKNESKQQFQLHPTQNMLRGHHSFSMPKPYASLNMPKKFPEDIQCIIQSKSLSSGSLYISNIEAAENLNTLKKFDIGAVLTCAKGYELNHPPSAIPHYKYIPTVDHDSCDISVHFDDAADFIKEKIAKTNILVHCIAGVSRSVSMVLAYLIREHNMTYEQAYRKVKAKRKIICPNDGFIKQLKDYHAKVSSNRNGKAEKQPNPIKKAVSTKQKSIQIKTPTKLGSYLDKGLREAYPSTQLTPTLNENKGYLDKYQSTEISSRKYNYMQSAGLNSPLQKKEDNYRFTRTSTGYFTQKYKISNNKQDALKPYDNDEFYRYPRNEAFTPVSQKIIPLDFTPQKKQQKALTPTKLNSKGNSNQPIESNRRGYFEEMNKELSEKIDLIRKKYDQQRTKLFEKYQLTDKKIPISMQGETRARAQGYETINSSHRKNGSLPSQKVLRRQPDDRVLNGEQSFNRNYDDVKQMFSRSRKSYAQIYETYMKGGERQKQPLRQEDSYYRSYNWQLQKKVDTSMNRYRPYARYEDYRTQGYGNYLRDPYTYLYKR